MARHRIPYRLEYAKKALKKVGDKAHYALIYETAYKMGDKSLNARPTYKQHMAYYAHLKYNERHFKSEGNGFFSTVPPKK